MSDSNSKKVEILHRINKLKMKTGADLDDNRAGFIDPLALHRAQQAIDNKESEYGNELNEVLVKLDSVWSDMKTMKDSKTIKKAQDQMFNFANNVKDLAETYDYTLMKHFGQSLRDFCTKFDVEKKPHHTIIQAHMDVMWVAFEKGIKDEGGPAAKELTQVVAKAIEKYS
jgi:hypothetical protein